MIFLSKGSVRTTDGWTFHEEAPKATRSSRRAGGAAEAPAEVLAAIQATAERHNKNRALLDLGLTSGEWLALFCALIEAESAYRPDAVSTKGAYGLGQLMAATARDLGVDRTDTAQNLDGSARYLLAQLATFQDIDLALAAYNAGPHRIEEFGGVPPFSETQDYIARVHRIRARLSNAPVQDLPRRSPHEEAHPAVVLDLNSVGSTATAKTRDRKSRFTDAQRTERP